MILFAVLCVVSMVVISTALPTNEEHREIHMTSHDAASDISAFSAFLAARAVKAAKAVRDLLSGATKVVSGRLFSRHFEMKGGYLQAQKDFKSLRPTDVKPYELPGGSVGKEGKAGDMTIMIGNKDELGKPYMKIYYDLQNIPSARFDKIIYMD